MEEQSDNIYVERGCLQPYRLHLCTRGWPCQTLWVCWRGVHTFCGLPWLVAHMRLPACASCSRPAEAIAHELTLGTSTVLQNDRLLALLQDTRHGPGRPNIENIRHAPSWHADCCVVLYCSDGLRESW